MFDIEYLKRLVEQVDTYRELQKQISIDFNLPLNVVISTLGMQLSISDGDVIVMHPNQKITTYTDEEIFNLIRMLR